MAVLLAGANDVLTRRTPGQWRDDLAAILDGLARRAKHVVVTGIPPFERVPALPGVLGRYLGERATSLDNAARSVCATRLRTTWISSTVVPPPGFFADDRFHPSASGYRHWAQAVADHLVW